MSGKSSIPRVQLLGEGLAALVSAIPIVAEQTQREVIVVGGLAVLCRLDQP